MDFEKRLKIDIYSLEQEWEEQPSLYFSILEEIRKLNQERLKLTRSILEKQSDVYLKIKLNPEKFGFNQKTLTEKTLESALNLNAKLRLMKASLHEIEQKLEYWNNLRKAFEERRRALENLTSLWLTGYYAAPSEKRVQRAQDLYEKHARQVLSEELEENVRKDL